MKIALWKIIASVAAIGAIVVIVMNLVTGHQMAERAKTFYDRVSYAVYVDRPDRPAYHYLGSSACVQHSYGWLSKTYEYSFVDDFNGCIEMVEAHAYGRTPSIPSAACLTMPERSQEQLDCIMSAETAAAKQREKDQAARWEALNQAEEAKEKAREAKEKAADQAITPVILRAIAVLHPNSDTERRQAAIYVSCKYDDNSAGYRVSLREYIKASQKGVRHLESRFDNGRYAICNQSQTGDDEWVDDDGDMEPPR